MPWAFLGSVVGPFKANPKPASNSGVVVFFCGAFFAMRPHRALTDSRLRGLHDAKKALVYCIESKKTDNKKPLWFYQKDSFLGRRRQVVDPTGP